MIPFDLTLRLKLPLKDVVCEVCFQEFDIASKCTSRVKVFRDKFDRIEVYWKVFPNNLIPILWRIP